MHRRTSATFTRLLRATRPRGCPPAHLCQGLKVDHTRVFHAGYTTALGRTPAGGIATSDRVTRGTPSDRRVARALRRSGDGVDVVDKTGFVRTPRRTAPLRPAPPITGRRAVSRSPVTHTGIAKD